MNHVKFADLIDNAGGVDGRLAVCFMYADKLSFMLQGSGLLVWVTGDKENKKFIVDINDLIPQRDHAVRKSFKVYKQGVVNGLIQKGLVHESGEDKQTEQPNINIQDVVRYE